MEKDTRKLFSEWRIEATLPANFDSGVWRRIEQASPANFPRLILDWLNQLFARPAFAFSYVALAVLAGLMLGQVQASRELEKGELELKTRYIYSIDPYAKAPAR